MKICERHWTMLREGAERRGMAHLVARNGQEALQNAVLQLEGRERESQFDPLMVANNLIWAAALRRCGLALMVGDLCPVCEGIRSNDGVVDPVAGRVFTAAEEEAYWIDGPLDRVLADARVSGELPMEAEDFVYLMGWHDSRGTNLWLFETQVPQVYLVVEGARMDAGVTDDGCQYVAPIYDRITLIAPWGERVALTDECDHWDEWLRETITERCKE